MSAIALLNKRMARAAARWEHSIRAGTEADQQPLALHDCTMRKRHSFLTDMRNNKHEQAATAVDSSSTIEKINPES